MAFVEEIITVTVAKDMHQIQFKVKCPTRYCESVKGVFCEAARGDQSSVFLNRSRSESQSATVLIQKDTLLENAEKILGIQSQSVPLNCNRLEIDDLALRPLHLELN